ncbi:major facilitator superfamily domain-containing protein [Apiospora arundinis]
MRLSIPSSRYFFEKSPGVFISRANLIAQTPEEELEADKILQLVSGDSREYGVYYDPSSEANLSRGKIAEWQWILAHLSCCISTLLAGYDAASLAVAQILIFDTFPDVRLLFCVTAASSLGCCCSVPLLRHIMDMVDLRKFRISAAFLFLAGSMIAGTATKVEVIIVGRVLSGIAIAGLQISLMTYNTLLATPKELSRLHLLSGIGYAVGLILGVSIVLVFTEWRWVFFLGGIMAAIAAVLAALSYPSVIVQPEDKLMRAITDIDWVGAIIHSLELVLFDAAFLLSGSKWAWNSVPIISIWAAIVVVFVFGLFQHGYGFWVPGDRILPLGVLQNRVGLGSLFVVAATAGSLSVLLYIIPLFAWLLFSRIHTDHTNVASGSKARNPVYLWGTLCQCWIGSNDVGYGPHLFQYHHWSLMPTWYFFGLDVNTLHACLGEKPSITIAQRSLRLPRYGLTFLHYINPLTQLLYLFKPGLSQPIGGYWRPTNPQCRSTTSASWAQVAIA